MEYVEAFNFRVQITKDVKNVKKMNVKRTYETTKYLFLLIFLGLFYLALLVLTAI